MNSSMLFLTLGHEVKDNSQNHIDRRSNDVVTDQENYEWAVKTRESIAYIQFKFDEIQNGYFTQTLVFLAGVELKKITPAWEDWFNSFILKE